jgi:putative sterol carrier protein
MTGATAEFFDQLARRGHEPLLQRASGTLRFDLEHSDGIDHWLVAVDGGELAVSRKKGKADCVIRTDRDLFDGVVTGQVNFWAAILRGVVAVEGDLELGAMFQRLFPGPPKSRATPRRVDRGRVQL